MKGYIEVKEDSYEDTIEHLHRIKTIACKLIRALSEHSGIYDEEEEESPARIRRGRYDYK